MSVTWCQLPKAGLGNQLFPLMKARTFAHVNDIPWLVTGFNQFKIGPYLRGEKSKRRYASSFTFEKSIFGELLDQWTLLAYKKYAVIQEPDILPNAERNGNLYRFSAIPHWDDYFCQLKENRDLVIRLFWDMLAPNVTQKVRMKSSPVIGVHIRMGDFRRLKPGEDFRKVGAVRTPEEYFIDVIQDIRKISGTDLPVSVFTDGFRSEFTKLFTLNNIELVEGNADIVDLLLLSKSKIIVASAGSTFSYWAGFLSNAPLIMHPDHIHQSIRPVNTKLYEGPLDIRNKLLIESIQRVTNEHI